jgi:hypothetical protein
MVLLPRSIMPGVMRFEKASSEELTNKRFQLGDGAITITRADDLNVPYPERTVWFWRDKPDPPDSGACMLKNPFQRTVGCDWKDSFI